VLTVVSWIITSVSLLGAVLNAKKSIVGFYIWIPANLAWVGYDIYIGQYAQAVLFIVYTAISTWGIYQWRKQK
jgi:nicotinamide riboside transporter PnuC